MTSSDALGFEKKLWEAADKLRSNMDAAVYKHVVLGLIFLKYISDAFDELYEALKADPEADEEDEDEYIAQKVFWVPIAARWTNLKDNARQPQIGQIIDDAMRAIEKRNLALKGVLPKDYARPDLDKVKLGELVDLIGGIGLGDEENRSKDILGRAYEYFLGQFASAEGKKGGQFYTPRSVVQLLVEILRPYKGRIYDPCCGSGGMFVQSDNFLQVHGGRIDDLSIYGQESNPTTWRLFKMNMAIRRISANIGRENADTFTNNLHQNLRADYIIANPPFNMDEWGGKNLANDPRWKYATPPEKNANFAWMQHIIHHLAPSGTAAFVLANHSLSTTVKAEKITREGVIKDGILDCIIALPNQLFFNTAIPACIWVIRKNKNKTITSNSTMFIDLRTKGEMISDTQKGLSVEEISEVGQLYHDWKESGDSEIAEVSGFSTVVPSNEIIENDFLLSVGLYTADTRLIKSEITVANFAGKIYNNIDSARYQDVRLRALKSLEIIGVTQESIPSLLDSTNLLINLMKTIFEDWFVNFNHPSLDSNDSQKESSFGLIPSNWEVVPLNSIAQVIDCSHAKKPEEVRGTGNVLLHVWNIVEDGMLDMSKVYEIESSDFTAWSRRMTLQGGDCILTKTGRVGAPGRIPSGMYAAMGRNMIGVRSNYPSFLICYLLSQQKKVETVRFATDGTVMKSLHVKNAKKLRLIKPTTEVLDGFEKICQPIWDLIDSRSILEWEMG